MRSDRLLVPNPARWIMAESLSAAALLSVAAAVLIALLALGLARAARRAWLAHPRTLAASVGAGLVAWLGATAWEQSGILVIADGEN
jgi:hypothetical protein